MEDGANEERLGRKARHFPFEIILWSKKENFIVPQENLQKLLVIILYSSECVHALCNNRGSSKLTTKTLGLCNCKLYPHHIVFVLCITEKVDKRMFFVKCNIEREIEKRAFSSPTRILTINRHRKNQVSAGNTNYISYIYDLKSAQISLSTQQANFYTNFLRQRLHALG